MIKVASMSLGADLGLYSRHLKYLGIVHRVVEESGGQSVYIEKLNDLHAAKESLELYLKNELKIQVPDNAERSYKDQLQVTTFVQIFLRTPITLSLIFGSVFVAFLTSLGNEISNYSYLLYPLLESGSFFGIFGQINSLPIAIKSITPMFLHFGELHLVFNMVWLWYFGKQLEEVHSAWFFILIIVGISFLSNTAQYLAIEYNNFGGMSGVIYGLVGYSWIITIVQPKRLVIINNNLFIFFVISLVLMELFASSWIATAAHLSGLLSGLVLGVCLTIFNRMKIRISHG